jgi:SEL1 protein
MYHYGMRGVEMNSTKALFYYDIAANAGDWESAGQAGKFHVWSLGMQPTERNLLKAKEYFQIGAPFGLEGCRKQFRDFLTKTAKSRNMKNPGITVCDHPSINGMGLLYLFGIPMTFDVDVEKAKEYFILARDMGNMDASYNLAMLRLGWKQAWKDDESSTTSSNGFTDASELSNVPDFMKAPSLTESDYRVAKQELINAASKGHLQASHRLAMMFHHGVKLPGQQKPTIMPDCAEAMKHYQWILDIASIPWSQRTRLAYTQYMQGNLEGSLRNYLMAAETGHSLSQVNAAFLFERGTCLGLSPDNCRKASLRLWKAAVQSGNAEAAIRVGDFYYYGSSETLPFRWLQPLLFPEKLLLPFLFETFDVLHQWIRVQVFGHAVKVMECPIEENGQCLLPMDRADFTKAAEYYRMASEKHKIPRAHFNMGFMFEWGLGVQQDFYLAKRYYDLAQLSTNNHGEADFVVSLALFSMRLHKMYDEAKLWWGGKVGMPIDEVIPPIEQTQINGNTKHVISLLIVILTLWLFQIRARTVR